MSLLEQIARAGVVGCGGAGFPTAVKLAGKFDHFIVNGAECEPLLRTDRYIMAHKADELVKAVSEIKNQLGLKKCTIALKQEYEQQIAALKKAVDAQQAEVEIFTMPSFYPAGDEQTITYEVTGRVVPPASLPSKVGVAIDNVATVLAIYDAMQGKNFTDKYLTVTGGVNSPVVLNVPIGTSYSDCIQAAGGAKFDRYCVISGGPMMGRVMTMQQAQQETVTKTTSGIIVLPEDCYHTRAESVSIEYMIKRAGSACIQCTSCTEMCPRHELGHPLSPHRIMRKMALGWNSDELLNDPDIRAAQLCCECGICETVACPMGLQPRKINSALKKRLAAASIRWSDDGKDYCQVRPYRDERRIPTLRVAARAGVLEYFPGQIERFETLDVESVSIPLKMHIGVTCAPVVSVGDYVRKGQRIAIYPENELGADIHSSIDGKVTEINNKITIVRG